MTPGEPNSAKWMFYDGYFLVLKIQTSSFYGPKEKNIQACYIMNDIGNTSWIDKRFLKIIVELQDEK